MRLHTKTLRIALLLALTILTAMFCLCACSGDNETESSAPSIAAKGKVTDAGLVYSLYDNHTAAITGYRGTASDLQIPAELDGCAVTAIEADAFAENTTITSVLLTDGLQSIGDRAFYNCQNLRALSLPESVETLGTYAFAACTSMTTLKLSSSLQSLILPSTLTVVRQNAFAGCDGLEQIYYRGSVDGWLLVTLESGNTALSDGNVLCGR